MKKFWENPANTTVAPQGARVPELLQIGGVRITPATILAPMAGVTDTVFLYQPAPIGLETLAAITDELRRKG